MSEFLTKLSPEKRLILATTLCVAISIFFTLFFAPKTAPPSGPKEPHIPRLAGDHPPQLAPAEVEEASAPAEISEATARPSAPAMAASPKIGAGSDVLAQAEPKPAKREIVVDTPLARWVFSSEGASLRSLKLKHYAEIDPPLRLLESQRDSAAVPILRDFWQERVAELKQRTKTRGKEHYAPGEDIPEQAWVELIPDYVDTAEYPMAILFGADASDRGVLYEASAESLNLVPGASSELVFTAMTASGLSILKRFAFSGDKLQFEVETQFSSPGGLGPFQEKFGRHWMLRWPDGLAHLPFHYPGAQEENLLRALLNDSMQSPTHAQTLRDHALEAGVGDEYRQPLEGRVDWVSIETRYFIAALVPRGAGIQGAYLINDIRRRPPVDTRMGVGLVAPFSSEPQTFAVYAGPKLTESLTRLGGGLERVVYDSWFDAICRLLEVLLKMFHSVIPSYGVAIILLCVLSKIVLYPLSYKQAQMQKKMAILQPKIAELKEKFKDDQQRLSQEQMKLWKKHGVNPASGCLPMLAQIPIFIALYRTIQSSIDLRGAPFLWIPDLSLPDMTFFVPYPLPFLGNAINILPAIMTAVSLWQMHDQKKIMPDPSQARMMMMMTGFFFFILYHFSSGLVLYWLTNNVTQIIQQKIMEHLGHSASPAAVAAAAAGAANGESPPEDEGDEAEGAPASKVAPRQAPMRKTAKPGRKKTAKS
ncbi:MAG: YidC/Oxa1 family insertase periplasmic-domain containing protein [Candidatus Omnitrophica bacterium]|nr:Membrane protein insertase YidC [bacterium]NUN98459.1 YidC/Oxa1 family insertase periplasmic-domain containing protein [Candidatus Omnitrophota bacterium]